MRFILCFLFLLMMGCGTTLENRKPLNESFPQVEGESLEKKKISIPDHSKGQPVLYLVGYVQDSQFDIDRWLIGIDQIKLEVKVYELPTIRGLFPRMFKTTIDDGMRRGIPKELWGGVITIYKGAEKIYQFTGNENPNNARVLLLDKTSKVRFFHDGGFSVPELNKLKLELERLK